jgi:hypothetical protein
MQQYFTHKYRSEKEYIRLLLVFPGQPTKPLFKTARGIAMIVFIRIKELPHATLTSTKKVFTPAL